MEYALRDIKEVIAAKAAGVLILVLMAYALRVMPNVK